MKLVKYTSEEVEEWAALYVDGELDKVGDAYLIDDRILELANVEVREGNFLLGGKSSSDVAKTSAEIEIWESEREVSEARKAALLAEANELEAQAAALRHEATR